MPEESQVAPSTTTAPAAAAAPDAGTTPQAGTQATEAPAAKPAGSETPAEEGRRPSWRDRLEKFRDAPDADDKGGEQNAATAPKADAPPKAGQDAGTEGEPRKEGEGEKPAAKPRYAITSADGQAVALALPEGASITFKADGKNVSITSMDELVQHAQMGVHAGRKLTEQGQTLQTVRTELEAERLARSSDENVFDTVIRRMLTDDAFYAACLERLEGENDPDHTPAPADAAKAARDQAALQEAQQAVGWRSLWEEGVPAEFNRALDDFPRLTADDLEAVALHFYGGYEAAYKAVFEGYQGRGLTEEQADALAREEAATVLTEENLRRSMGVLNAHLEQRFGTSRPAITAEQAAERNAYMDDKTRAQDEARTLRAGGGSQPVLRQPDQRPASPEAHTQRWRNRLDKLRNS